MQDVVECHRHGITTHVISVDIRKIIVIKKMYANNFLKTIQKGDVHTMRVTQFVAQTELLGR